MIPLMKVGTSRPQKVASNVATWWTAALGVALLAGFGPAAAQVEVLAPDVTVAGVDQSNWSQRWWQWAGGFRRDESPVTDPDGGRCDAGQTGAVWFLAGTYGSHRVVRRCRVPAGTFVFFPLVNYVVVALPRGRFDCRSIVGSAKRATDDASFLFLEIDGKRVDELADHRQASVGCFTMLDSRLPAASDGYYVMLAPLPRGTHVLHFGGRLPTLAQAVTYTLIVE